MMPKHGQKIYNEIADKLEKEIPCKEGSRLSCWHCKHMLKKIRELRE